MGACRELNPEPSVTDMLIESHADALKAVGWSDEKAMLAAKRIVDQLLQRLGGGWFYLPKGVDFTREAREARNALILEMVRSGKPKRTIMATFRIKKTMYYQIIGRKTK